MVEQDLRQYRLQWTCKKCGSIQFNIIVYSGILFTVCANAECKLEENHFPVPETYYEKMANILGRQ